MRILFVDDDHDLLRGLKRTFMLGKYRDVSADFENSPAGAIERLNRREYDAVVTDYKMPGMDCGALLNLVKEKQPGAVRIVFTGYFNEALGSGCYSDPSVCFLRKPVVVGEIMGMIEMAMEGR